jgi:hypothetical protein
MCPNDNPPEGWEVNWEPKLWRAALGVRILGLDASPYIRRVSLFIASAMFLKLEHFTLMNYML